MQLGLDQAHDLFGRQPFDLRRFESQLRQHRRAVLADARRRPLNSRGGMVKTRGRNGLTDPADVRMVKLGYEFARQYLLVGDHLIAPQHGRRRHIVGIEPLQPFHGRTLLDNRMPQTPPRSIRLTLRWLNSPLLRLACSINRRFVAASASATMCSDIGSAPPPLLAATGNSHGRSRVGTQSTPAAVNCNSRALRINGISSGRNSFDVS